MTRAVEWLVAGVSFVAALLAGWVMLATIRRNRAHHVAGKASAQDVPYESVAALEDRQIERITEHSEAQRDEIEAVAVVVDADERSDELADLLNRRASGR